MERTWKLLVWIDSKCSMLGVLLPKECSKVSRRMAQTQPKPEMALVLLLEILTLSEPELTAARLSYEGVPSP